MTLDLGTSDAKGADLTSTTTDECYGTSRGSSLESKEAAEEFEPKKVWLIALATYVSLVVSMISKFNSFTNLDGLCNSVLMGVYSSR